MKILNAYAGIGGNRKLWGNEHQITAIEKSSEIAAVYKSFFPQDTVLIADAHQFILNHHKEFDFIWSSPPCQSHSKIRYYLGVKTKKNTLAIYPEMTLWQEIIFLKYHADCAWVIENVRPYYTPLINPDASLGRHLFWSNRSIPQKRFHHATHIMALDDLAIKLNYRLEDLKGKGLSNIKQVLRNCVMPEIGEHILNSVL